MKLYQEELMDHYRFPRHKGKLELPDFASDEHNPSCGDSISMQGQVHDGRLVAIAFEGKGCVISQATASMLAQASINHMIEEILTFDADFIRSLIKIEVGPTRLKCAMLPLVALHNGIALYQAQHKDLHA